MLGKFKQITVIVLVLLLGLQAAMLIQAQDEDEDEMMSVCEDIVIPVEIPEAEVADLLQIEDAEAAEGLVIGVSNLGLSFPFTAAMSRGIQEAADELGVEIVEFDGQADTVKQTNDIQDLITQEVDGIILIPLDSAIAVGWVDEINEAEIPVVATGVQVSDGDRELTDVYPGLVALITQDEIQAGCISGQAVVELLPDGGEIAILEGAAGFNEVIWRNEGFMEILEAAGNFEIVAQQPGNWIAEDGEAACQNMLQANPEIDLIYAHNDDMGVGCQRAVESAGSEALVFTISGGTVPGLNLVEDGDMAGTICYRPATMGAIALITMVKQLTGAEEYDAAFISYTTPLITADNLDICPSEW